MVSSARPADLLRSLNFGSKTMQNVASVVDHALRSLESHDLSPYEGSIAAWRPYLVNLQGPHQTRRPSETVRESCRSARPHGSDLQPSLFPQSSEGETSPGRDSQKTHLVPPDLYVSLPDLSLSVRALNCLTKAGVRNLHELILLNPKDLWRWKNLGRKTFSELVATVQSYLGSFDLGFVAFHYKHAAAWLALSVKRPPAGETGGAAAAPPRPADSRQDEALMDVIGAFIALQNERNREIIIRRLGLASDGRVRTLAAIGRQFGLTRERIRQIASKAHARLVRLIRRRCRGLLTLLREHTDRTQITSIAQIASALPQLGQSPGLNVDACLRAWLLGIPDHLHPLERGGQLWTSRSWVNAELYEWVLATAERELSGMPTALNQVTLRVAAWLKRPDDSDVLTIELILRNSLGRFTVRTENGIELLAPVEQNLHDRRRAFAYDYIRGQGVPIKIGEIVEAMDETEPALLPSSATRQAQINALKGLLERDDRFAWAGPSMLGLREWGYEIGVTSIGQAAVALLRAANKPLRAQEIHDTLRQLYRVGASSVTAALSSMKGSSVARDGSGRWHALR